MTLLRKFIDWKQPGLPSATEFLIQQFLPTSQSGIAAHQLDMGSAICVLPGRRACRQLLKLLAIGAKERNLVLVPPKTVTLGDFPELLYHVKRPFASDFVQTLTWISALKRFRRTAADFFSSLPDDNDLSLWLDLGQLLKNTHWELAAAGLDFRDVIVRAEKIPGFTDLNRWRFLRRLQQKYLDLLSELELWDQQTARKHAIEKNECRTDNQIFLIGTVDINRAMQMMLDQVNDQVTSIVFAPEAIADRFDHYGCLLVNHWDQLRLDIHDEQIEVVDRPSDQSAIVLKTLEQWQSQFKSDEVSVCVPDSGLITQLGHELPHVGIEWRWSGGRPIRDTAAFQLLRAICAYLNGKRFVDFAALVRHPIVSSWINRQDFISAEPSDWLTQLDDYFQKHLQPKLGFWLGRKEDCKQIRKIHELIENTLAPLSKPKYRKLGEWAAMITQILSGIFESVELDREDPQQYVTIATLEKIRDFLGEFRTIPDSISPSCTSVAALEQLQLNLAHESIADAPNPGAIDLLGWLELPLDLSSATIITSFNDHVIPHSKNADLLLPNSLRTKLNLVDNSRHYARDAYAMSVLLSRRQALKLIVGRRNSDGEPLTPSRLLFATNRQKIAQRVQQLFREGRSFQIIYPDSHEPREDQGNIAVPKPKPLPDPIERISVTAFRSYLACPYYFYLNHGLDLNTLDDQINELSPPSFGNAIHDVLEAFGESEFRDSTKADEIRGFLREQLAIYFERMFGKRVLPAVEIQQQQSRIRLDYFADWQANWASEGWTIKHSEVATEGIYLTCPKGRKVELRGRIDRIDFNENLNQWAILDYKTGDHETHPEKKHRDSKGNWLDLQLPLYRTIARQRGLEPEPFKLGYIALPKDVSLIDAYFAEWTDEELDEAEKVASEIVGKVLDEQFWPMTEPSHPYRRDFSAICQDHVLDRLVEA